MGNTNFLWTLVNLVVLVVIGWPISLICSGFYVFISPFAACLGSGCDKISDILKKGVEWPRGLGKSIANGDDKIGL